MIAYRYKTVPLALSVQDNTPTIFFTEAKPKEAAIIPFERLTIAKIQAVVSEYYGLDPAHMRSKSRDRGHVYPRQLAMLLVRELLPMHGLTEIGRRFGGRDHTTVMHGLKRVKERIASDTTAGAEYATLRAKLGGINHDES